MLNKCHFISFQSCKQKETVFHLNNTSTTLIFFPKIKNRGTEECHCHTSPNLTFFFDVLRVKDIRTRKDNH